MGEAKMTKMQFVVILFVGGVVLWFVAAWKKSWECLVVGIMIFFICFGFLTRELQERDMAEEDRTIRTSTAVGVVNKAGIRGEDVGKCMQTFSLEDTSCAFQASCSAFPDFTPRVSLGEKVRVTYLRPKQVDDDKCVILSYYSQTRKDERERSASKKEQ
jgi:hypothetical protein